MKSLFIAFLLFLFAGSAAAQYSLTFCEDVGKDGKATRSSNSFMVGKHGSALDFLVKSDGKLNTDQMDFRIYYINESGKEEEISKLPQKVEPGWNYAWKEVVFFDRGNYRIKVYDSKGDYLTSANLNVKQYP